MRSSATLAQDSPSPRSRKKHKLAYATAKRYAPNAAASRKGPKPAGEGDVKTKASKNGRVMIAATPQLVDAIWNSLSLEKKSDLIGKM
jgi:hypothetical protein